MFTTLLAFIYEKEKENSNCSILCTVKNGGGGWAGGGKKKKVDSVYFICKKSLS